MATYTVEQVIGEPRDWQTKAGKAMKSYLLKVSGEDRNVELSQYPDTDPPTVGQVIDGTLEESQNGNFPPKLKRAKPQGGFGGGGGMSPEREKRIVRQHSQTAAVALMQYAHAKGISVSEALSQMKAVADLLDKDAGV